MEYTLSFSKLYPLIDEDISRVAAASYSENGDALYDAITLRSTDEDTIRRLLEDAFSMLITRFSDLLTHPDKTGTNPAATDPDTLDFYVPDFETSKEADLTREIDRFLSSQVVATYLVSHAPNYAQEYGTRSESSLNKIAVILKTRRRIVR